MRLFSRSEIFRPFIEANKVEGVVSQPNINRNMDRSIQCLFKECGGASFQNGLYRVHTPESSAHWAINIRKAYAQVGSNFVPFGFDWLARQFALDLDRRNVILLFDPSTMKYYDIGFDLVTFHNKLLVEDRDGVLSEVFFVELLKYFGVRNLGNTQCIGHKKPLFLGGTDSHDNFQITDIEVHWHFQHEIYERIKDLPEGTKINEVTYLSQK